MKEETKPEMTAEEFLRCWIEDKEDITLARQHLRSVIRGKTVEKSNAVVEIFKKNRFDKDHHLGMGDIRLTVAQQDAIIEFLSDYPPLPCGEKGCINPHEKLYRGCDICKFKKSF